MVDVVVGYQYEVRLDIFDGRIVELQSSRRKRFRGAEGIDEDRSLAGKQKR